MAIYMKLEGITGSATAKGHEDEIVIENIQFGAGRGISMEIGDVQNRASAKPTISEISITKNVCKATAQLLQSMLVTSGGVAAEIFVTETSEAEGADRTYIAITLRDVMVSSFNVGASKEGMPHETLSLSFTKINFDYTAYDKDNIAAEPQRAEYDIALG